MMSVLLPLDRRRGVLQYGNYGTNPLVQEEARLGTGNGILWSKLRMHLPYRHQESTPAYEVRGH